LIFNNSAPKIHSLLTLQVLPNLGEDAVSVHVILLVLTSSSYAFGRAMDVLGEHLVLINFGAQKNSIRD